MSKISVIVSCPIDTYSGYGARARDFVKALLVTEKYDVKILSQRWGNTRFGYLADHKETDLSARIIPQLTSQPDIWIQITVPNEFQKIGKYNIGVTAGIETTLCDPSWIKGCNNMDLVLISSNHAKQVFSTINFNVEDNKTKQVTEVISLKTKVEVLFEGADVSKYFPIQLIDPNTEIYTQVGTVKESFCYLFVGHWMQGDLGHDRKNVGYLVKAFLETFKNKKNAPALVLKTQTVTSSILDREKILDKIDAIRKTVKGTLPSIYLLHGDISDTEMNELYNHPKVKAMISLTKGEGFGRPLLEFSLINKPIITSAWSGHIDFLNPAFTTFISGTLEPVHSSASADKVLLKESKWFKPDDIQVGRAFKEVVDNYEKYKVSAKRLGDHNRTNFSFAKMVETLDNILTQNLPEFPKQVQLTLPKLELPKLKKL